MDNFVFSVNSVLPIFVVIFLGYLLKRKGFLDFPAIAKMNDIVFTFALPVMLFRDISNASFRQIFDIRLVLTAVVTTLLSFALSWVFAELFLKEKSDVGTFVQGSFRSNYAIIGLPLVANIMGEAYTGSGALIIMFVVPMYNILSVVVLSVRSKSKRKHVIKDAVINICKNPLILGIIAGLPFSFLNVKLPLFASKSVDYLTALATPLALLAIGGSFDLKSSISNLKPAVQASIIKLIFIPLVFVPLAAFLLNIRGEGLVVLYVLYASPAAVSSYIMASKMDGNGPLASNIVLITSLVSVITFTAGIFLLKSGGLI